MVYDFEDQLIQTRIGSNSSTPLQTVDFTYNEQGWLTGINPTQNGDLFTQSIAYQSPQNYAGIEYPDLAGNISQIMWQIDGLDEKAYNYKYDDLYRIVNADFLNTNGSSIDDYSTSYSCDSRGNISSLDRRGKFQNGSWVSGTIDSLEYDYLPGTNKIRQITDEAGPIVSCAQDITVNQNVSTGIFEASGTIYASGDVLSTDNVTMQAGSSVKMEAGFKASSNGGVFVAQSGTCSSILKEVNGFIESGLTTDYMYDENGNLEYDSDKEITIIYNHLNLPDTIKKASGDLIVFRYSATGMKLQRTTTIGTTSSTYDYINGIEYYNGEIEAVYGNGYRIVKIENGNGTVDWEYEYHISDHLGNTRVAFIDSSGFAVKTQVNDYYPFGMKMYNEQSIMKMSTNRYLYNNKELIGDLDIGLYDYGARFYDPSIGRFLQTDRFAEKYTSMTPYQYGANNPLKFIDINGDSLRLHFVEGGGKNGNDLVQISVTGTIIDNTSSGLSDKQLARKRRQIAKGIIKAFSGSNGRLDFEATADLSVSEGESDISEGDHVFRLVDDVAETIGIENMPGVEAKGQADPFQNFIYLDSGLKGRGLKRTSAHELGHSGGLAHIKDAVEMSGTEFKNLSVNDYPRNLMHQTRDVENPGFKVRAFQIRRMLFFNDTGVLNKGKQK